LARLSALPIRIVPAASDAVWDRVLDLAREHDLTAYDAAYLELAIRERAALATLDPPCGLRPTAPACRSSGERDYPYRAARLLGDRVQQPVGCNYPVGRGRSDGRSTAKPLALGLWRIGWPGGRVCDAGHAVPGLDGRGSTPRATLPRRSAKQGTRAKELWPSE
jgi:hypothetical protein